MEEWKMELENEIESDLIAARAMLLIQPDKELKEYIMRLEEQLKDIKIGQKPTTKIK